MTIPLNTESTTVSLDDGDLHVRQDGPRDAPALLLIHGTAASAGSWDLLVPLLTESHHVIRVDLLGHGRSAQPNNRDYHISEQGRRVGEAMDRLGVEHVVVVGHSSGGMVATALTEQRPDLVTALALINTGPGMDALIAQESAAITPSQWPPTDEQIRQFASNGFGRPDHQIPQELVDDLRGMPFEAFAAVMQAPRLYLEQRTLPDRLKVLGKPLQVIFGEDDRRWRSSSAADYRVVPHATVEMLPGVGH
ncbi:alpha/beta hydrolase, partial [Nonomuraea sp. RK-328]|nr:alpha/beta hydrolase [Nonomuraea sp. RK-328]